VDARLDLGEGDVEHPVEIIFDGPVMATTSPAVTSATDCSSSAKSSRSTHVSMPHTKPLMRNTRMSVIEGRFVRSTRGAHAP